MYRRLAALTTVLHVCRWAPVLLCAAVVGCGGGSGHVERPVVPDDEKVAELVRSLMSVCETADGAKFSFVEGAAPSEEDRKKYASHQYEVVEGSVQIDGDTATAKATVLDEDQKPVGEMECVCVRDGEGWLFKSVTFP